MLSLDDFKKLEKYHLLNDRFITGGGTPTEYDHGKNDKGEYDRGDDMYYSRDCVVFSGHVLGGGTEKADPKCN